MNRFEQGIQRDRKSKLGFALSITAFNLLFVALGVTAAGRLGLIDNVPREVWTASVIVLAVLFLAIRFAMRALRGGARQTAAKPDPESVLKLHD